ncbi:leucine-rich repeat domain-containing protein [Verrucomicrobia bacterium]|nr:leucine-rich repeat domain-containing protein [Verrucomicrobiota bacterium]
MASVTIPDSVTHLAWGAFEGCRGLTSLTIPDSVSSIQGETFSGCSSLTSVTIPDSVTSIGDYAFSGCTSLTSVTIPDSVISIYNGAFEGCTSLKIIIYDGKNHKFGGDAPKLYGAKVFSKVSDNAKVFINPEAIGFAETYGGLPVIIEGELEINTFSKSASPFTISFESKSDSTYTIEVTQDFKQWSEIGEVQGTGSSVKFTDPRLPIVPFERNYFRVELVE